MKKIILTGGGTAGHVTPNIALLPRLRELDYEISYIGSYHGIEKGLIEKENIPYYAISSGKLRRYFDPKNFSDPFKVMKGYLQARHLMFKLKPDIVFSKGGFVSVPVVLAAKHAKIPVIIHESDITPGLANRLAIPSATRICCNFPETLSHLPEGKAVVSGSPIRRELLDGDRKKACTYTGLTPDRPTILIIGGSQGSQVINEVVRRLLPGLLTSWQIIHLCGKGNLDPALAGTAGYVQYEYINEELADLFAAADLVISRAGANAICELQALAKPNILIPLSKAASRGDQILNARSFEKQGFSYVIEEEHLSENSLSEAISSVWENRKDYTAAMKESRKTDAIEIIVGLIEELKKK
ncbi:MAG: undecaprenyldiphospho-muramoylpentapeptide beta-N-acetylglucosaminyltransferase [Clostridiales bacterium]|nr:undecaprenyldiphospho-muramoylpentapeptide beta-N-acetylglucosaminyltransferase [Clostridiales bacterium]MCD8110172.1 undecaprenyldiphospho-muramoylpentapeptide beta-N-acetylglucosaminyltransferase [Clostridiales bacterium]